MLCLEDSDMNSCSLRNMKEWFALMSHNWLIILLKYKFLDKRSNFITVIVLGNFSRCVSYVTLFTSWAAHSVTKLGALRKLLLQ
jgi:hypothetical protein